MITYIYIHLIYVIICVGIYVVVCYNINTVMTAPSTFRLTSLFALLRPPRVGFFFVFCFRTVIIVASHGIHFNRSFSIAAAVGGKIGSFVQITRTEQRSIIVTVHCLISLPVGQCILALRIS
uniref:Uncharacterized protein n=1 Tax=Sipha flava TaxID=143950 RepID=A0A2S2PVJ6_9HEMI